MYDSTKMMIQKIFQASFYTCIFTVVILTANSIRMLFTTTKTRTTVNIIFRIYVAG